MPSSTQQNDQSIILNYKWRTKNYQVDFQDKDCVKDLKAYIESRTGVESQNQKLLYKGSILKNESLVQDLGISENESIMVLGTPTNSIPLESALLAGDEHFSGSSQINIVEPCGILNLGNTCYMNSIIQLLTKIPDLPVILEKAKQTGDLKIRKLLDALQQLFSKLKYEKTVSPIEFLLALRTACPQFAEKEESGQFAQQDAEEFAQFILSTISRFVEDTPYSGELSTRIQRSEASEPTFQIEKFTELSCHISQDTSDLLSGLQTSLSEKIELPDSMLMKTSKICKPPAILLEGTKAKIMKKIRFPLVLDTSSISMDGQSREYSLQAVVTHSGRTADSGHYICWFKDNISGSWWKMDDEKVSSVYEEDIKKLDGGGDWPMAYLCLYQIDNQQLGL